MKIYNILLFVVIFYEINLCGMEQNQVTVLSIEGVFLSIDRQIHHLLTEQEMIDESDLSPRSKENGRKEIQAEVQKLQDQKKSYRELDEEIKQINVRSKVLKCIEKK